MAVKHTQAHEDLRVRQQNRKTGRKVGKSEAWKELGQSGMGLKERAVPFWNDQQMIMAEWKRISPLDIVWQGFGRVHVGGRGGVAWWLS